MTVYYIRIKGHLPEYYSVWFDVMTMIPEPNGQTVLTGSLADQGALFGVLLKIRDMGLPLLEVTSMSTHKEGKRMTNHQLTVTGFMTVQPGTEEILLKEIDHLVAQTRAEPGCLNYDFHQHNTDSQRFIFYENFVDMAAFEEHLTQPHTKAWVSLAESYGARFEIQFWTMVSQPG